MVEYAYEYAQMCWTLIHDYKYLTRCVNIYFHEIKLFAFANLVDFF